MKVGFIGLGMMGGGMSLNIRRAGYDMIVHDIRQESGARQIEMGCEWADSVRAVAEVSDVVFTSLPGPPQVKEVALGEGGLLGHMKPGAVYFDLSTNSPTVVRDIHAQLAENGVSVLDAPVSGGTSGANTGKLAVWVGGDEALFNEHKAIFDAFSDQASYVGPIGAGTIAKLVHNMTTYIVHTGLAEVFTMGVKAGVPALAIWEAVRQGASGRARTFDRLASGFLDDNFDPPNFMLGLAHKDVTLAVEVGREAGVPMRICSLVHAEMTEAMNRGWASRDSRVVTLLQQERAGVEIKESPEEIKAILERDGKK